VTKKFGCTENCENSGFWVPDKMECHNPRPAGVLMDKEWKGKAELTDEQLMLAYAVDDMEAF